MPRDLPAPGADLPEPSPGATDRTDRISGPEAKARLLDLAATRTGDAAKPVDSNLPERRGEELSGPERKARALDRLALGHDGASADVIRRPTAAPQHELTSAERKAILLDQASDRLQRSDRESAGEAELSGGDPEQHRERSVPIGPDRPVPTDLRPPITEKAFNHVLNGEWSRKGKPVGFHSAPEGVPPEGRRVSWAAEPTVEGAYGAKVEFRNESTGEWREKKVRQHTMFPDSWSTEKVRGAVQSAYDEVYDTQISPALRAGSDLSKSKWTGSYEGVHIRFYVEPDGSVRTAFPVIDEED